MLRTVSISYEQLDVFLQYAAEELTAFKSEGALL